MSAYPREYYYKKIVFAKLYIDTNYADSIDIENIANEALFTKFDFIRQFKKTYGVTPYNYLKKVRLRKADELLKSSNVSVRDVCFKVGYSSISSFSALFKKEFGAPPLKFQKDHLQKTSFIHNAPLNYIPGCFAESKGWKKSNFEEAQYYLKL